MCGNNRCYQPYEARVCKRRERCYLNTRSPFRKMEVVWYGIISAPSPRITTQNAPSAEQKTFDRSVHKQSLTGIF